MKKRNKKLVSAFLGLMTVVSMFAVPAYAAGRIDTEKACSIEIQYKYGDVKLSDVEFELYHVADIDEYARFTLTEAFSQYPVEIGEYSGSEWNELAGTLDGYVTRDSKNENGPKAVDTGKTDADGVLRFPNQLEEMEPGLYLLIGENSRRGSYRYTCDPSMLCVPGQDHEANDWVYDISVFPKSNQKYIPDDDPGVTKVSRRVIKSWNDEGFEANRPDSITVTLWKNGEEFDSAILSDSNNWSYTWKELDKNAEWKVTEDVPDGYTVKVSRDGNTFIVKNSKMPVEIIPDPSQPSGDPDDPRGVLGEYDENNPLGVLGAMDMLPQTGTTWWLAAALAGAGLLLLGFGVALRRKA